MPLPDTILVILPQSRGSLSLCRLFHPKDFIMIENARLWSFYMDE